jgi:hypothetical protein
MTDWQHRVSPSFFFVLFMEPQKCKFFVVSVGCSSGLRKPFLH